MTLSKDADVGAVEKQDTSPADLSVTVTVPAFPDSEENAFTHLASGFWLEVYESEIGQVSEQLKLDTDSFVNTAGGHLELRATSPVSFMCSGITVAS